MSENPEKVNLLIIDDNVDDRELFRRYLSRDEEFDFEFFEAETGKKGVEIFNREDVDCILLDYRLPDIDGIKLIEEFERGKSKDSLPIVAITHEDSAEIAARFILNGAKEYLKKSNVTVQSLKRTIFNTIEKARLNRTINDQQLEIVKKNRELENSNLYLQDFCHTLAHDLKNPLFLIQSFLGVFKDSIDGGEKIGEEHKDMIEKGLRSSDRMASLISDMLNYADLTKEKSKVELLRLNELAEGAVEDLELRVKEKGASVKVGELPSILANRSQVYQIFLNLISNALKFTRDGVIPEISVEANYIGGSDQDKDKTQLCQLIFSDNGIGIAEDNLKTIFQPFKRLHSEDKYEGTGIGLATVKKIIAHHYGSLSVKSKLGEGTTFTITLPLRPEDRNYRSEPRVPLEENKRVSFVGYEKKDAEDSLVIVDETTKGLGCMYKGDQLMRKGDILYVDGRTRYEVCWIKRSSKDQMKLGLKRIAE